MTMIRSGQAHIIASSYSLKTRLIEEAPYFSRCSDNKTAMLVRPRDYAVKWPYMQVNRKEMKAWMVFDIDHEHRALPNPYIWQDEGLPPPNLIVRDRTSNKAHLFYAIVPVCTSDNANAKPIAYYQAIYRALALRLEADMSYCGPVAKTPFHADWMTTELHRSVYELGELADSLELETEHLWRRKAHDTSYSRNCTLFEHTRQYAYSIVGKARELGCYIDFKARIEGFARYKNVSAMPESPPLPSSEVQALVKSVSRWTWDKYFARADCQRGVMKLDTSVSLHERQRRAARRTHRIRRTNTARRIVHACQRLLRSNLPLTIGSVARMARLCRQTISRYVYLLERVRSALAMSERNGPIQHVNDAVHQISAPVEPHLVGYVMKQKSTLSKLSFP
ncbi:replication initiation protein [Vibrio parahaemolyticus]|uniref:replication initiation protein n=2 Tax=Vibrio parahaemolyticus TaxID=670 RepID=UPI0009442FB3|nr:replication initiation protein [Vibrio parahaemolyticus]MBE3687196.1 replication protein A [Vibrio parahaemolyticus]MBE3803999.1 replication protein A [Vibrio parahaemolyticus]MBE3808169.1 replication protein A [Vibrio parahaemolyticus]MBE4231509.1 replication protein A [Vibrio parahaemolyticus]MBE4394789.1 replication protein A [Vibrio parahaemolyticus]